MSAAHGSDPLRGVPMEVLRGFEASARLLNFTRAAEALHLTQSAISREMRTLEGHPGTRLFERVKGGLRLTHAGLLLQKEVESALSIIRRGLEQVSGSTARRTLPVLVGRGLGTDWLMRKMGDFMRRFPLIDIRLSFAPRPGSGADGWGQNEIDIDKTDYDVAILLLPRAIADDRWERVWTEYVLPCCTPQVAAEGTLPLRMLADLKHRTLLDFDDGEPALDGHWRVWCALLGIPPIQPAGWLKFPDWNLIFRMAIQGRGVCLGRLALINDYLREGSFVAPLPEVLVSTRSYYLLRSTRSKTDANALVFSEWLLAEAKRESDFAREFLASKRLITPSVIGGPNARARPRQKSSREKSRL